MMVRLTLCLFVAYSITCVQICDAQSVENARSKKRASARNTANNGLAPTYADVSYGSHERNQLDVWCAKSDGPTPLVIFIHGGGFVNGDKSQWRSSPELKLLLERGVSCAALNYPFRQSKPIQEILRDAARAVQFLRSKASEWNLDKDRFAAQGGSAGAGTSLWLASRDDLADPAAIDPVLRESSKVCACVLNATQATYHLGRWSSFLGETPANWAKSPDEGPAFYGLKTTDELNSPAGQKLAMECDMLAWISRDDGPVLCIVKHPDGPIRDRGHMLHHPKHAEEVRKVCELAGVSCSIVREEESDDVKERCVAFLLTQLKAN